MTFQPSPQQAAFLERAVMEPSQSIILVAVAGAGKTTTILRAVRIMSGSSAILAYNKKIAEEIKAKLKRDGVDWKKAEGGTVHSFGLRALTKMFPKLKGQPADSHKVGDLCALMIETGEIPPTIAPLSAAVCELVSFAKQRAIGVIEDIDAEKPWMDIIEHFNVLDNEQLPRAMGVIAAARGLLKKSNALTEKIDFDDMVYLPLIYSAPFWQYDNVVIDEAQDTNPARRELVKRMVKRGGRVIAVGDPCQGIYGFTGADNDALDIIKQTFNCVEMPLTVTFRCPKEIVKFAKRWVNHIEAHESAPDGKISFSSFEDLLLRKDLDQDAAILCRNTKPLVKAAFAMIRARIPCRIEGREVGKSLKALATRWSSIKTLNALETKLETWQEREVAKARAKRSETLVQQIEDKVDTLKVIMQRVREEGRNDIDSVVRYIDQLFGDNVTGMITLSTIHKSKGREWKRVFWLDRINTCPSPYAKQAWESQQEINLQYVAATRSMSELIEVAPPVANTNIPAKPAAATAAA